MASLAVSGRGGSTLKTRDSPACTSESDGDSTRAAAETSCTSKCTPSARGCVHRYHFPAQSPVLTVTCGALERPHRAGPVVGADGSPGCRTPGHARIASGHGEHGERVVGPESQGDERSPVEGGTGVRELTHLAIMRM